MKNYNGILFCIYSLVLSFLVLLDININMLISPFHIILDATLICSSGTFLGFGLYIIIKKLKS